MSRRCKPGQRARIIAGSDRGQVVLVVRQYCGELINGSRWPEAIFPWVVTSLGRPLASVFIDTQLPAPPVMTVVVDDDELEPLHDDDLRFNERRHVEQPRRVALPAVASAEGER